MNFKKLKNKIYFVRPFYHKCLVLKNYFWYVIHRHNYVKYFINKYKKNFKNNLNYHVPIKFSEKIYYCMMYLNRKEWYPLVDKIEVKNILIKFGYSAYVTKTLKVLNNKFTLNDLPNECVIKCNHDSGSTYLINKDRGEFKDRDGRNVSFRKMKHNLKQFIKTSTFYQGFEIQYKLIKPRIFCEEILKSSDNCFLADYKIFCNYGKPILIYCVVGRNENGESTFYTDCDFKFLYSNKKLNQKEINIYKPKKLSEMLNFASSISSNYPIARVDLYYFGKNIIKFGEIAFSHYGGTKAKDAWPNERYDIKFGSMFKLNDLTNKSL